MMPGPHKLSTLARFPLRIPIVDVRICEQQISELLKVLFQTFIFLDNVFSQLQIFLTRLRKEAFAKLLN